MNEHEETLERRRRDMADELARSGGWRWWLKLGAVVLTSVVAVLLILAGAVRFLDQAEEERGRVACLRAQVQAQARGNADMATAVLDARVPQSDRQAAFRRWADQQASVADAIGRC